MDKADVVIKSNAVFTGDGLEPFKGGVAVRGDKIVACGDDAHLAPFIGPDTEVRDFGDQLVMPGLIDSHTHFAQGAFMTDPDFAVNLIDCTSLRWRWNVSWRLRPTIPITSGFWAARLSSSSGMSPRCPQPR